MSITDYISRLPHTKASFLIDGGLRLEEEVPGYRTISAEGRDSMELEINEIESKIADGAYFRGIRLPTRDITVSFVLIRDTVEELHESYTKLKGLLYSIERTIFNFDDEPDVYYVGTVKDLSSENIVLQNDSQGTFTIHCSEPFKYSNEEFEVDPDSNDEFIIDYDGYYKSYPRFEVTFPGDCGFIGFTNGSANLQFGDPNELDKGYVEGKETKNVMQISKGKFTSSMMNNEFTKNDSTLINLGCIQNGQLSVPLVTKQNVKTYDAKGNVIKTQNYSENVVALVKNSATASSSAVWPGVGFKRQLNADPGGSRVAKNFFVIFEMVMDALAVGSSERTGNKTDPKQVGMLQVVCATADKKPILALVFIKNNQSTEVEIRAYAGQTELINERVTGAKNKNLNCSADSKYNKYLFWDHGEFSMSKIGNKVDFYIDHKHHTLDANAVPAVKAIINEELSTVDFFIGQLDTTKRSSVAGGNAFAPIRELYVRGVGVLKYNATTLEDVPNKFTVGNILDVNTENGTITLDGITRNDLGAVSNGWDDLYLYRGEPNIIKYTYSSWAQKPTVKLYYRKVFV